MAVSCQFPGGGMDGTYYIYVAGVADNSVQISYLGREILDASTPTKIPDTSFENNPPVYIPYGDKNVVFTENVKLPFFKEVAYIDGGNRNSDVFLEVISENDSTTKAIIFEIGEVLFPDSCCISNAWREYTASKCAYCKELPKDSVLNYLKAIHYPCYLEFSKGDTRKTVIMRDYWGR
jgi:hypothetical protein